MNDYSRDCQGMTLLEILLALVVLSIVMSLVSMSLSSTIKVADSVTERGDMYYRAQVALTRISEDLTSAVFTGGEPFTATQGEVNGARADTLRFASMAHLVFGGEDELPGLATISYSVKADEQNRGLILYRDDRLYRPLDAEASDDGDDSGEPAGFVLCNHLKSVKFSFMDAAGEEVDSWEGDGEEGENAPPVAVTCTLEFALENTGEEDDSLSFTVSVPVPAGLIRATGE